MTKTQSTSPRTLQRPWIERIFMRLQGIYGSQWLSKWTTGIPLPNGGDAGLENAINVWAEELSGYAEHPEYLKYALTACNTNPYPPSLADFKNLCNHARQTMVDKFVALPPPTLTTDQIQERKNLLNTQAEQISSKKSDYDHLMWAKNIRDNYLNGQSDLLPIQIKFASEALGEVWLNKSCTKI